MSFNSPVRDDRGDTLVSAGKRFELGFFTPNGSNAEKRYATKRYVGIWYHNNPQTVVWVANREKPVYDSTGVFAIAEDGNLKVLDGFNISYWSTELEAKDSSSTGSMVTLMDSGNLVMSQEYPSHGSELLWQSFSHPTDTFLPGMKMDENIKLTSWSSLVDPAPGYFTFQQDEDRKDQYVIKNESIPFWESRVSGSFPGSDDGFKQISDLLMNSSSIRQPENKLAANQSSSGLFRGLNSSTIEFRNMRLVMHFGGQVQFFLAQKDRAVWSLIWQEPKDKCSESDSCGGFASCNNENTASCKCLPGFEPVLPDNWNLRDFSQGCSRIQDVCSKGQESRSFQKLKNMIVGKPSVYANFNETKCKDECLKKCSCQAYSYKKAERGDNDETCWIWFEELNNILESYARGRDLNLRIFLNPPEVSAKKKGSLSLYLIIFGLYTLIICKENGWIVDKKIGRAISEMQHITCMTARYNSETS
ncbi:hypothetical protein Tsubulata_006879 [Turnera subulata]|uniref:non-specific serine/threonine protein kinase n=1 Tax=Turnera subulata TaxID=218843 RepID=A0A9Q0JKW7_9ROSI|nr:hypothetical protein Tsubulata_006879 [Turnera subulata]